MKIRKLKSVHLNIDSKKTRNSNRNGGDGDDHDEGKKSVTLVEKKPNHTTHGLSQRISVGPYHPTKTKTTS